MKKLCLIWTKRSESQFLIVRNLCEVFLKTDTKLIRRNVLNGPTPKPYDKNYNFFSVIGERKAPVCWALLKSKLQSQYEYIFQMLREKFFEVFWDFFNPETIISYFKLCLMAAVSNVLPYTSNYGCYFHYTQAIYQKLQIMGFTQTYKKNEYINFCSKNCRLGIFSTQFSGQLLPSACWTSRYTGTC